MRQSMSKARYISFPPFYRCKKGDCTRSRDTYKLACDKCLGWLQVSGLLSTGNWSSHSCELPGLSSNSYILGFSQCVIMTSNPISHICSTFFPTWPYSGIPNSAQSQPIFTAGQLQWILQFPPESSLSEETSSDIPHDLATISPFSYAIVPST